MSSIPKKPPLVEENVDRGAKSQTEEQHSGFAVHRSGTHSHAEHAEAENRDTDVRRPSHKLPISESKKGDGDADIL